MKRKRCIGKCGKVKACSLFHKSKQHKSGRENICKECRKNQGLAWAKNNKDKRNAIQRRHWHNGGKIRKMAHHKKWVEANRLRVNALQRKSQARLRREAMEVYGGPVCKCCGEKEYKFLTFDHPLGGGRQHRIKHGNGQKMLAALKRAGWPKKALEVLCFNCNCGRAGNGGVCPHKERK